MENKIVKPRDCRLVLFVDDFGLEQVLPHLPLQFICGLVGASIRPNVIGVLRQRAAALGRPLLLQPKFGSGEIPTFIQALKDLRPTMILANSYSMILRPDVLEIVEYRAMNVHSALLPRNRGPNPLQWALIHGETRTGVTMHYLSDGLDTGPIICQRDIAIQLTDTWVSLQYKIASVTQQLFQESLLDAIEGRCSVTLQDERLESRNPRLTADSPRLDLERMSDMEMFNWIRAQVAPLKGAYVQRGEERLHIPQYVSFAEIPALRKFLQSWMNIA